MRDKRASFLVQQLPASLIHITRSTFLITHNKTHFNPKVITQLLSIRITMSSPGSTWSDRRGLFQKGKEVHDLGPTGRRPSGSSGGVVEAVRRASVGSTGGLDKTESNASSIGSPASPPSPSTQRRRSSNTGLFGNLQSMKRGSEDYAERRASHAEQGQGGTGMFSQWYNSTFRGSKGVPTMDKLQQDSKRGVK